MMITMRQSCINNPIDTKLTLGLRMQTKSLNLMKWVSLSLSLSHCLSRLFSLPSANVLISNYQPANRALNITLLSRPFIRTIPYHNNEIYVSPLDRIYANNEMRKWALIEDCLLTILRVLCLCLLHNTMHYHTTRHEHTILDLLD